ncbi:recombinase family protein [Novosphingobium guangzhouense]|uniref:Serine recombinase n=1 Tax=Novosphingobium guangzhouense TaxID=1850347 RepID=A0A2K2FUC7_9SPHN|nr:recombinase family protein [Novosphingobium guangzhouense]PNU02364.1 serine recombinase [Novosphingobium guangzhouense]
MIIRWDEPGAAEQDNARTLIRAAQYVRMSTEHQQYSTDNQAEAIARYAEFRGYEIVRTYADEGKSGLNISGRAALQSLIRDIENGEADFEAVLVYDISRWGRFQDPDEAASYELRCRRAGISVHYCTEQFENDGSIGSSIIKTVKRAMAGEYSRELSVKVFAGQANLVRLGFRQGGAAGFGLRRTLVDQDGRQKGLLGLGEHKSIQTDRVVLTPGPEHEQTIVRQVYLWFVQDGKTEAEIAALLNARRVLTDLGRQWTRGTVHQLLINEKYIGNNVWARTSFKLKQQHVLNPADNWIRHNGAFSPIVDKDLFDQAQRIIEQRCARLSDDEMLAKLRAILALNQTLSGLIIDEFDNAPSSSTYRQRFGSLLRAYALVGFAPRHDYRYIEANRRLRAAHPNVLADLIGGIERFGGTARFDPESELLHINDEFTVMLAIARCFATGAGSLRWKVKLDFPTKPDIVLTVRMNEANEAVRDYYVLPRLTLEAALLRLCEHNGLSLDAFQFPTADPVWRMAARVPVRRAA